MFFLCCNIFILFVFYFYLLLLFYLHILSGLILSSRQFFILSFSASSPTILHPTLFIFLSYDLTFFSRTYFYILLNFIYQYFFNLLLLNSIIILIFKYFFYHIQRQPSYPVSDHAAIGLTGWWPRGLRGPNDFTFCTWTTKVYLVLFRSCFKRLFEWNVF